ncbi:ClpP/crotonase-like domain-containing protein, partial [Zopfochytrium polystomum]
MAGPLQSRLSTRDTTNVADSNQTLAESTSAPVQQRQHSAASLLDGKPPVKQSTPLGGGSNSDEVIVETTDRAVFITINRPERDNAMTETMLDKIIEAVDLDKMIVVDSVGPHFCTGWDLWSSDAGFHDEGMQRSILKCGALIDLLRRCRLPVVSVCRGGVRGGGMLLPCCSDLVLAETKTTFAFPEIRLGGIPGVVSVAALNRIPQHVAKRMMLLGTNVSALEAKGFGLVDVIAESAEELAVEKRRLVNRMLAVDPKLMSATKANIADENLTFESAIVRIGALNSSMRGTDTPSATANLVRLVQVEE